MIVSRWVRLFLIPVALYLPTVGVEISRAEEVAEVHIIGIKRGAPPRSSAYRAALNKLQAECGSSKACRSDEQLEQIENRFTHRTKVVVSRVGAPITLVLSAATPTDWKIELAPGAILREILFTGHRRQRVTGLAGLSEVAVGRFEKGADEGLFFSEDDREQPVSVVSGSGGLTTCDPSAASGVASIVPSKLSRGLEVLSKRGLTATSVTGGKEVRRAEISDKSSGIRLKKVRKEGFCYREKDGSLKAVKKSGFDVGKIIGGAPSTAGARPWQALLIMRSADGKGSSLCGGSLISDRWVVTAAHCVSGIAPGNVSAWLGKRDLSVKEPTEQSFRADRVIVHPGWSQAKIENDIALVRLSRAVVLTPWVGPIDLASGDDGAGVSGVISGWGLTVSPSPTAQLPSILQEAKVSLVESQVCSNSWPYPAVRANEVCAGVPYYKGETKGTCKGDSGGPLAVQRAGGRWELVGITSWGDSACMEYSVFSRVSSHRNWILRRIGKDDLVWQSSLGQVHYWAMDKASAGGFNIEPPVGKEWRLLAVGDLNGDSHEDIVWQHSSGQVHYWAIVNGVRVAGYDIGGPISADWKLKGAGDVDGDGRDNLIWQHASGQVHYWTLTSAGNILGRDIGGPVGSEWELRGIGDVDGDSTDDLIWRHVDGQAHFWKLGNGAWAAGFNIGSPVGPEWALRGVGDLDGDGTEDLVWQHTNGQVIYWQMSGGQWRDSIAVGVPVDSLWSLLGVGNLNMR